MPEEYTNVKSWNETCRGWYFNATEETRTIYYFINLSSNLELLLR